MKKLLLLFIAILLSNCSSNEPIAEANSENFKPEVTNLNLTTKIPNSLQSKSPIIWAQISMMETYVRMGGNFMNPSTGKTNSTLRKNTWNYGGYTVTYSYDLVGDKYEFHYIMSLNNQIYSTIDGWQKKDGSSGHWKYNINLSAMGAPSTSNYNIDLSWNKNSANNYTFDMIFNLGSSGTMRYITHLNNDYSGDFNYYMNGSLIYNGIWNANGGGRFTNYMTSPPTITTWN
jgi:hypothetical protein